VSSYSDDELSKIRNEDIGFIFQSFNLIPQLSVFENVQVPLLYGPRSIAATTDLCHQVIESVGLSDRSEHRPTQLSGGECQRVAIARALINDPVLLLADEPTGNLDTDTGDEVLALIDDLHQQGRSVVMITHDPDVANRSQRRVDLRDGIIVEAGAA
jgi:putative ABC transport system ATP-binding protein